MNEQTSAHAPVLCSHHSHHNRMWNVFPNVHRINSIDKPFSHLFSSHSAATTAAATPEASNNRNITMPWINNNNNNNEYESKRFTCKITWLCIVIDWVEQRWLQICSVFFFELNDAFHLLLLNFMDFVRDLKCYRVKTSFIWPEIPHKKGRETSERVCVCVCVSVSVSMGACGYTGNHKSLPQLTR